MNNDLISRQAAIDALLHNQEVYANHFGNDPIDKYTIALIDNDAQTIAQLPSAQRWIPVSERLPNCNGCYLVWRPHFFGGEIGMPSICYFDGQNTWHDSYGVDFERVLSSDDVTAWMPLPEPYKEENDG